MRAPAGAKSVVIRPYNNTHPDVASRRVVQVAPPVQPAGTRIIAQAKRFLGTRNPGYVMGGTSPVTGFDCSGYTQYAYREARVANLPRTAEQQRHAVRLISGAQARPGDLVFYLSGGSAYHIAIYAGNGMQYAGGNPAGRHQVPGRLVLGGPVRDHLALTGRLDAGGDGLLVQATGAVGRAHQRPAHDAGEADLVGLLAQFDELLRLDPAGDRMVPRRRAQVLRDRDQLAARVVQVGQRLADLVRAPRPCRG